jgi:hypothetical protein
MRIYFLFIKCSKKYTETVKIDKPTKNIYCPPNRLSHPKSLKKPSVALLCFKSHQPAKPTAKSYRSQNRVSTECFILAMIITAIVMRVA